MGGRTARKPSRRRSRATHTGAATGLAEFFAHPSRPPDTLRHHELQGFLFAVACAPDLVPPTEWIPEVFGGHEAGFDSLEQAQAILNELVALYNTINASVISDRPALPADCRFRRPAPANFDDDAPIACWSRGFLRGYQWLEEDWAPYVSDDLDQDFSLGIMTLTFFASRRLAAKYAKEMGRMKLDEAATVIRRAFPLAIAEHARFGRSIYALLLAEGAGGTH